jgi:hypothetical protein
MGGDHRSEPITPPATQRRLDILTYPVPNKDGYAIRQILLRYLN